MEPETEKKCKCDEQLEKYKLSMDFLRFEANSLWTVFSSFFFGNNIFIVLVGDLLTKEKNEEYNYGILLLSGVVGLSVSLLWLRSYQRNSVNYLFRLNQVKRDEEAWVDCIKDDKWYLINRDAPKFAEGKGKPIEEFKEKGDDSPAKLLQAKGMKNRAAYTLLISIFIVLYGLLIVWSMLNLCPSLCSGLNY